MRRAVKTIISYVPRWQDWRTSAILAAQYPDAIDHASAYSSDHKWKGWRDRENQLIFLEAVELCRGNVTLADFHKFARMVIAHQHPDIVACHAICKAGRPELEAMQSATMARRKVDATAHVIDHVTLDDLGLSEDDM